MTMHPFLTRSPYEADAGEIIGRDPRTITETEWAEVAGEISVGLKAIRLKCMDCCGNNSAEVRKCTAINCALWPLRMGSQPKGLRAARRAEEADETPEIIQ